VNRDVTGKRKTCLKCGQVIIFTINERADEQSPAPTVPVAELTSSPPPLLRKGGVALALLAWLPGISALPLAIALHNQTLGIVLAGIATGVGAVGFLGCLTRRGTNAALLLATMSLCALILVAAITLVGDNDQGHGDRTSFRGHGIPPQLPEEKTIAAWILANEGEPTSVEFIKWGPHDLEDVKDHVGEVWSALLHLDGKLLTVRYRCASSSGGKQVLDGIFTIKGGEVRQLVVGKGRLADTDLDGIIFFRKVISAEQIEGRSGEGQAGSEAHRKADLGKE
jgi:hypothetical protein